MISLLLIALLSDEGEEVLDLIPAKCVNVLVKWMMPELIQDRLMKLDQWLEIAFHLCKQRWDESVDWMEHQPMSKIMLMTRIQTKFNTEQEREMKKNSRKR